MLVEVLLLLLEIVVCYILHVGRTWQLKAELQYTVHTSKQQQLKHLKVRMLTEGWMN